MERLIDEKINHELEVKNTVCLLCSKLVEVRH